MQSTWRGQGCLTWSGALKKFLSILFVKYPTSHGGTWQRLKFSFWFDHSIWNVLDELKEKPGYYRLQVAQCFCTTSLCRVGEKPEKCDQCLVSSFSEKRLQSEYHAASAGISVYENWVPCWPNLESSEMYLRGRLMIGKNSHMHVPNSDWPLGSVCVKWVTKLLRVTCIWRAS